MGLHITSALRRSPDSTLVSLTLMRLERRLYVQMLRMVYSGQTASPRRYLCTNTVNFTIVNGGITMRNLLIIVTAAVLVSMIGVTRVAAQNLTDTHLQAAEELLIEMDMEKTLAESINVVLDAQLQQTPELAQFEDVMRAFLQKYMSWQCLKEHMVQLYAEAFTEQELREIVAFYRTETGRKVIELTPVLMRKGMALGQQAVQEHMPELEQMILERMQELNSDN